MCLKKHEKYNANDRGTWGNSDRIKMWSFEESMQYIIRRAFPRPEENLVATNCE